MQRGLSDTHKPWNPIFHSALCTYLQSLIQTEILTETRFPFQSTWIQDFLDCSLHSSSELLQLPVNSSASFLGRGHQA